MSISRNTEVSSYYHLNREFKSGGIDNNMEITELRREE